MSKIRYIKNEVFGEIGLKEDEGKLVSIIIDDEEIRGFDILAVASKMARENKEAAWRMMKLASCIFHPQNDFTFDELYGATAMEITRVTNETEFTIHAKFKENAASVIDGAEVINKTNKTKHQPDAWVLLEGKEVPVEMKLGDFNYKALKQLRRYIDAYNCDKGIAVANDLTIDLPENIMFFHKDEFYL